MNNYVYDPTKNEGWEKYLDPDKFKISEFYKPVVVFLHTAPNIKELIENNKWEEIFDLWAELSTYIKEVLAFAFWQAGIDFMPYLSNDFIRNAVGELELESESIRRI